MTEDTPRQRLYRLGVASYLQYDGTGPPPEAIKAYVRTHFGELPPHIPLPRGPVEFDVGYGSSIAWDGTGDLPVDVMAFVCEHGVLPLRKFSFDPGSEVTA